MIASGGFADARGLVAALALGADGVNMGTRFLCTVESPIAWTVKQRIVANSELDTQLIFRTMHNTARVADNAVSRRVVEIEKAGGTFDDVRELVAGARGRKVYEEGDLDAGIWSVGQCQGLIDDIPTCQALIERIVADAEDIINGRLPGRCCGEGGLVEQRKPARRPGRRDSAADHRPAGPDERSRPGHHARHRRGNRRGGCGSVGADRRPHRRGQGVLHRRGPGRRGGGGVRKRRRTS